MKHSYTTILLIICVTGLYFPVSSQTSPKFLSVVKTEEIKASRLQHVEIFGRVAGGNRINLGSYTFDNNGQLLESTFYCLIDAPESCDNPEFHTRVVNIYDSKSKLIEVKNYAAGVMVNQSTFDYEYNEHNQLDTYTLNQYLPSAEPIQLVYQHQYNDKRQLIRKIGPNTFTYESEIWAYDYDEQGRIHTETDGKVTTLTIYEPNGAFKQEHYHDSTGELMSWESYDSQGRVVEQYHLKDKTQDLFLYYSSGKRKQEISKNWHEARTEKQAYLNTTYQYNTSAILISQQDLVGDLTYEYEYVLSYN